jgi:tetratricopeptide (TPR) repeat protein
VKLSLASTLERERKYAEAEATFRQIIADDPKDADALNSLAYMFAERGQKLEEAVGLVQQALAIEPGNGAYLDTLGWAYYKQNRFDQSEAPLREAAEKLPAVSVIQDHLGDLLSKRGSLDEAIAAWQKALDGDGDSITRPTSRTRSSARQGSRKSRLVLSILLLTIGLTACGRTPRVALRAGRAPAPALLRICRSSAACRTWDRKPNSASGRAAGQRMRGRVAGLVRGAQTRRRGAFGPV